MQAMRGRLLDTNHVGHAVRRGSVVLEKINTETRQGIRIGTCVPVLCEIESGRLKVAKPDVYRRRLNVLLKKISLWPLTRATAEHFGEIDQELRRRGRALSQVDIMLAALCRELNLTLITTDKDFAALPWLKTENWI
jgi:tRNA(fMet)-specific endonuclease VapC